MTGGDQVSESRPETRRRRAVPDWQDDWIPSPWTAADPPPRRSPRRTEKPADGVQAPEPATQPSAARNREMVQLAISPLATGIVALLVWLVSPLPGIMSIPVGMVLVALVPVAGIVLTSGEERPFALSAPWMIHLALTLGLLPLLATEVSLLREPYVSLGRGTAAPAIVATIVTTSYAVVLAIATVLRFWREPDQAALVFLPAVLLIALALGQRSQIEIRQALLILGISMVVSALATVACQVLSRGIRLLVPPLVLLLTIAVLWTSGRGPTIGPTSGEIVRLLYLVMLLVALLLVVAVPATALWLRKASMPAQHRSERRRAGMRED